MYSKKNTNYNHGFTLIELLVTIAIVGIVMSIAIPNFTGAIANSRLTTSANELITAFNIAKSEAIKRGYQITIRRKGSTSQEWHNGWDIFVDEDASNSFNDNGDTTLCEINADGSPKEDCLLKTYGVLPTGFTLKTGASTAKDYVAYLPTGMSKGGVGDTFRLCHSSGTTKSRAIILNAVGRAYVSSPAASCP